MKKVFIVSLVIAGLLAAWGCSKSADSPANRGESEPAKPPVTEETTKTEQPTAVAVSPTATAVVEVKAEVKPTVLPHTIADAEVGLLAVCPVMKTPVTVNKNTLSAEYKGKVYYFCCDACPGQFKDDPEKFITTETKKK